MTESIAAAMVGQADLEAGNFYVLIFCCRSSGMMDSGTCCRPDPIIYWYRMRIEDLDDTKKDLSGRLLPVQAVR
jgi:hypothetical protein